jgi:5-formyltetrahydrofolate cyclo-ligase
VTAIPRAPVHRPYGPRRRDNGTVRDIAEDKTTLRTRLAAARARSSEESRAAAARALRDSVLTLPEAEMAGTVAAYVSVGDVPKLLPGGDLDWASYEGPDSLRPGRYGLQEPVEPPRGPAAVRGADLIIVPALAVASATGVRLGRGGGSYDRVLSRVDPGILTIAAVYDDELVESLPAEPHDRPVRAVVTPSRGLTRLT